MAWSWGKFLKSVAKGIAKAVSLGLIGRGEKTRKAGEVAGDVIDEVTKEEKP